MIAERQKVRTRRDLADELRHRAELLDDPDRALLEQVIFKGVLPRELALLTGGNARAIQRRVRSLTARLMHPEVLLIIRNHQAWPTEMGQVAMAVWVRRRTLRHVARDMGLSLHAVRQHVENVRGVLGDSSFGRPRRRASRRVQIRKLQTSGA